MNNKIIAIVAVVVILVAGIGVALFSMGNNGENSSSEVDAVVVIYGIGTPDEMITEDMIRDVYDVQCSVVTNHGSPHVILESVLPVEMEGTEAEGSDRETQHGVL